MTADRKPATINDFEAKYQQNSDPWDYRGSWYEQRKYAVTLACLPRPRYRLVWEPACSIGVLTGLLAQRADRVLASDASATAVAAARAAHHPGETGEIDWSVQTLPAPAPCGPGQADLVMLSEILYYLPPNDFRRVLRQLAQATTAGGRIVLLHHLMNFDDAAQKPALAQARAAAFLARTMRPVFAEHHGRYQALAFER